MASLLFAQASVAQDVTVSGPKFLKDGKPWVAEGVTLVGLVSPAGAVAGKTAYEKARAMFGPQLLDDVRGYGADLVRYQFSQAGLDPRSAIFDPVYVSEVLDAVRQARAAGFNVIISMQWQGPSGMQPGETGMPSASTDRAWLQIVDALAHDKGILLEVFNEPALRKRTPENWEAWRAEMQGLIYLLRGAGSRNVLLIDGLNYAHNINNPPELTDPLDQLAYAVHPFLSNDNQKEKNWANSFGEFSKDHPVMATAFMAWSGDKACNQDFPEITARLLDYLDARDIGLVIWAFDLGMVRKDGGTLRNFDNFSCGTGKGTGKLDSAAQMIHDYFMSN